jgi:hypothetical protein
VEHWYKKYLEHLHSDYWETLKKEKLEICGHRCQRCGAEGTLLDPLECHHLHYRTVYHEGLEDVEIVCVKCHCTEHGTNRIRSYAHISAESLPEMGWDI